MTALPAPTQTLMYQEAQESARRVADQLQANQAAVAELAQELRRQPPRFVVTRGSKMRCRTYRSSGSPLIRLTSSPMVMKPRSL